MIGSGSTRGKIVAGLMGAVCAFIGVAADAQTPADELPGTSYESLAQLPDWRGWWIADAARTSEEELAGQPAPFNAEAAQARSAALASDAPVPLVYCRPREFTGQTGGFTEALEFLFTPGRVTLTTERGLIRRIYTDGSGMPENPEYTNTGTSIGRWEGNTLIVETAGIDPRVHYPDRSAGGIPFGENVVIRERVYQVDESTLRFDVEIIAPEIFTMPDRRSHFYRRLSKTMANEISWCSESDRSLDPKTGRQRFDMTPPPSLPPPPSR